MLAYKSPQIDMQLLPLSLCFAQHHPTSFLQPE